MWDNLAKEKNKAKANTSIVSKNTSIFLYFIPLFGTKLSSFSLNSLENADFYFGIY